MHVGIAELTGDTSPTDDPSRAKVKRFRFEEFEFHNSPARLISAGSAIKVRPQALQVLELLLTRAGEVLTREEIRHHLWGNAAYLDHERGINSALLHLRKALDDDPQSPRFIETVPRHGYRFIAPVELSETPLVSVRKAVGDSADAGPKRWPRIAVLTAVLAVLLGLSALWGRLGTLPGAASLPRLVVYPMQDSSEGTDTRPSPMSLTDALVRILVTEHADRFDLTAPEPADPEGATAGANQPDADLLVMSSLTFDEHGDYGITITLVRASDRTIVWAQTHHLPTEQLASWPELAASDLVTAIDGLPTA